MAAETQEIRLNLPPISSLTIGEIENKLIYVEEKQQSEEESRIIKEFIDKKGLIFKWIRIPMKYFERYSSSKNIESNTNADDRKFNYNVLELLSKYASYFNALWNLSSPFNHTIISNNLVHKYNPAITQQNNTTNYYYSNEHALNPRNVVDNIIKFDYHPLHRQIIVAFKNGIVFFDIKRNCWLSNILQNENQTDITDFAFSESGQNLAVTCSNGIFIWNLRAKKGELIHGLSSKYDRIIYSPCCKYVAVYKTNATFVEIYDVYLNKMVYRHSIYYRITEIQWIASKKANKYCPLRLLFVTDSAYIFLLNLLSFKTETFQCQISEHKVTQIAVSKHGNGILAITSNKSLYYISMKQFSEPQLLVDLYLDQYEVYKIKWSQCDRRIAVMYKDTTNNEIATFISIWAYDFSTLYHLGYITNPQNQLNHTHPTDIAFRNHFNFGALLAICWSNAIISQHHLCFPTQ